MSFIWIKFADNDFDILYWEVNIREWFDCDQRSSVPLSINEHCFAEKDFAVFFEVSDKFVIWKSGGIQRIFLQFKRVFNRAQKYLELVDVSDNFCEIFPLHSNWKQLIELCILACKTSTSSSN